MTVAQELINDLAPILKRYGFVFEGVSPSRYRAGSGEWVLGKVFSRRSIRATQFRDFIARHFVQEVGGYLENRKGNVLTVRIPGHPLLGLPPGVVTRLVVSTSATPEDEYEQWRTRLSDDSGLFVSMYGRPANESHWSHDVLNWIDGEDLRARFFPVEFETPEQESFICTIRHDYADALIPSVVKPSLLALSRVQIRPDNVFYRAPTGFQGLRRGASLFFYTSAEHNLRGSAKIQRLRVDTPEECLARFGKMGILQFDSLLEMSRDHSGMVLAIAFDWYDEYSHKPILRRIREAIPGYNPISGRRISWREAEALKALSAATR